MSSADPNQAPEVDVRYWQHPHHSPSSYGEYKPAPPHHTQPQHMQPQYIQSQHMQSQFSQPQYLQPHYSPSQPTFIAELPAPLPVAPPTTTPQEQLAQDEQLARKLVQLEVQEARSRSNSRVSQHERPVSLVPDGVPGLSHPRSSQALRADSQRMTLGVSINSESRSPSAYNMSAQSLLPEVIPLESDASQLPEVVPSSVLEPVNSVQNPVSLPAYLEEYRQVLYPPQWKLAPPVMTLYAHTDTSAKMDWLDTPESCSWRTTRRSEVSQSSPPALYTFKLKTRSRTTFRDARHSWTMTCNSPDGKANDKTPKSRLPLWEYELRLERGGGVRKTEVLNPGGKRAILTTYVHASNYDSLRFVGPDSRAYQWVSSGPLSSAKGGRYDTLRHALFVARGSIVDPLYGDIVADHAFWDGFGGAQPDEALCIRSRDVQCALVVATLQVLKDWQKRMLRKHREQDPEGFRQNERLAREQPLGALSHWRGSDGMSK